MNYFTRRNHGAKVRNSFAWIRLLLCCCYCCACGCCLWPLGIQVQALLIPLRNPQLRRSVLRKDDRCRLLPRGINNHSSGLASSQPPLLPPLQQQRQQNQQEEQEKVLLVSRGGGGGGDVATDDAFLDEQSRDSSMESLGDTDRTSATSSQLLASQGRVILCLVALLYGTLNVSLRMVYQLPDPPTAAALSATRGWLASACFLPLLLFQRQPRQPQPSTSNDINVKGDNTMMEESFPLLLLAGLELAVWNGLAMGLLNVGLLSTGSARASFLTQTSVVLTPLLSLLAGQAVAQRTWVGCAVAMTGLSLLAGGSGGSDGGNLPILRLLSFSSGDVLVLGGALAWSCYLFRLSQIGSRYQEVPLQFIKTLLLAFLYTAWFFWTTTTTTGAGEGGVLMRLLGGTTTTSVHDLWSLLLASFSLPAWAALWFSALVPGTLADVLQQQGQRHVSASEANVLLSMEPVFAALCAWLVLGEVTTMTEIMGGGLILAAAWIASTTGSSTSTSSVSVLSMPSSTPDQSTTTDSSTSGSR